MTKGVYCYIDKKDDSVVYVGRDSNIHINKRHKAHFTSSKYSDQVINQVLQNNPDRYTYQRLWEIDDCTDNHLNEMEIYYIKKYNPKFNFTDGGDGISGFRHSEKTRKKMSENNKGENNPFYNKKHTKEWKKQHSGRMKGENHPNWGKKTTEETKRKMSKNRSEKYNTTGFYRVSLANYPDHKKGFRWYYRYRVDSQQKSISSTNLKILKEKVLEKNLEWYVINEENALKSLKKDEEGVK